MIIFQFEWYFTSKISVNVDEKWENPFISAHQIFEEQDVYAQQVQVDLSYATSYKKLYQRYKAYG